MAPHFYSQPVRASLPSLPPLSTVPPLLTLLPFLPFPPPSQERLFDQSDAYRVHVCEKSGLIAVANLKKQQFSSQIHKNDSSIVQVGEVEGGKRS